MTSPDIACVSEYSNWRDKGCELSPTCLNCTLPRCIEEEPRGKQKLRMAARMQIIVNMRKSGKRNKEIALAFNTSIRTIQRALSAANHANTGGTRND